MAIKMVREPSETPNINNIDDIIPMRYAYGGQNGFVIGKGNEISNSVSGLNFTVNSGRLVLQGVECDIDATGVTITIDNIATKRYYTIYLEVNLGLNTATIKSEYDTATYPTIDAGDDLTANSTGIARMVLYKFTATSGVIGEVNKVVDNIGYPLSDYDTSKGTIEERLTNLGFKQGSVELNTALTGYSYIQVTKNTILRQGNYVLLNLTLKSNNSANTFGGLNQEIGTISTAFLPSQTQTYNAIVSSECSDYSAFEQKYVTGIRDSSCVITISQNGSITETQGATFYNTSKNGTTRFYSMEINIGYEAKPLE